MTSRLVLFGSTGFIGAAIQAGLGRDMISPSHAQVDLLDAASLTSLLLPGDVIVNATGYAAATDQSPAGLARFRRDNVDAVRSLADAAAAGGAAQLIHLSSVAAMGQRTGTGLTEGALARPRSPYGQSKRDAELVLAEPRPMPVTILRPTSVFGESRGLAALLCRLAKLPLIPLPDGGRAEIPFTYVGNVVEAVRLAIGCEPCLGKTFIVGDERSYRLAAIVTELSRSLRRRPGRILPVPAVALHAAGGLERLARGLFRGKALLDPIRIETLTSSVSYSIAAFQEATEYSPRVSMSDAASRIATWYGSRGR